MGEQFYSHELAKRFANPVDMSDAAFIRDISRQLTEKSDKIAALEAELANLRAKVPAAAQSDIDCAIAIRALISEGYNDGDIEAVIAAHVAPLRAQLDEAVAERDAWQTVACFLAGLMIPVGQFDVRRLFQWVRSGKDLAALPTGDAEKGAGDE